MLRVERKFRAGSSDAELVAMRLRHALPELIADFPDRIIHSLYFDDSILSHYQEHLDGAGERSKFRIRWYRYVDSESGSPAEPVLLNPLADLAECSQVNFEAKLRIGSLISKATNIAEAGPIAEIARRYTAAQCYVALARKAGASTFFPELFRPVVYVSYLRRYLRLAGTPIRVTIDSAIRYAPYSPEHSETAPLPGNPVIVEVKCPKANLPDVAQRLRALPWPEVAFSKYMTCLVFARDSSG